MAAHISRVLCDAVSGPVGRNSGRCCLLVFLQSDSQIRKDQQSLLHVQQMLNEEFSALGLKFWMRIVGRSGTDPTPVSDDRGPICVYIEQDKSFEAPDLLIISYPDE